MPSGAALKNGCAGTRCYTRQETYAYNNRLQSVLVELGAAEMPADDYYWTIITP